ncbi:hypothetical protein JCM10908_004755 [Rhodotorula pacifica]|uniref:Ema19p n=1 Tax=Rhodotorula pacifica TaxID=1495444 RepID=UPI003182977F
MFSATLRDRIYLIFLAIHIPATLLVDVQALFCAERFSPAWLRKAFLFAAQDDPLLQNANAPLFAWFQSFIILEVLFQVPVFFLGVRGLWKRDASIWPLLALYGASSSTTTFACLATVLTMPGIKPEHLVKLLASYVPFFLVPLAMAVDYGTRLTALVWAGHKVVCGPGHSSPYTPPSLTDDEAAYLTSLAETPRPEQMDEYAKPLWTCWRKCLATRPTPEKAKLTYGRMLELLAEAKLGSFKKLVKACQHPESIPDPDRARALITYARAIIFLAKRASNSSNAKHNPAMSVTNWAAFVGVILQIGHSNLRTDTVSRALLSATLHRVTIFATINDLYTGRQRPPPTLSLNPTYILTSFQAMVDPLLPVFSFQSMADALIQLDFLIVLNGRDCGFGCIALVDPSMTRVNRVQCTFGPAPPAAQYIVQT